MQKPKHQNVDKALCKRFVEFIKDLDLTDAQISAECGLKSRTTISEIRRYVIEPSKRIMEWMMEHGASGHWVCTGKGPMRWSEVERVFKDNKKMLSLHEKYQEEITKNNYEIQALKSVISDFVSSSKK